MKHPLDYALLRDPAEATIASTCNPRIVSDVRPLLALLLTLVLLCCDRPENAKKPPRSHQESQEQPDRFTAILAPLIDPDRLDTLKGERAATPRLRKACHWLEIARREGQHPDELIDRAHASALPQDAAREAEQKTALLRNLTILDRLGCLDSEGMEKLRRGRAPTITKGPYTGELATGDHIIPRSVCEELDNCLFNLEFMPETLNRKKAAKVGQRQIQLANRWHKLGLLSDEGLNAVFKVKQ